MTLLPMDWFGWVITSGHKLNGTHQRISNVHATQWPFSHMGVDVRLGVIHADVNVWARICLQENKMSTSSEGIVYINANTHNISIIHNTLDHGEIEPDNTERDRSRGEGGREREGGGGREREREGRRRREREGGTGAAFIPNSH